MHAQTLLVLALVGAALSGCAAPDDGPTPTPTTPAPPTPAPEENVVAARLHATTDEGTADETSGWALFLDHSQGVRAAVLAEGLAPGLHGTHVHENGACGATTNDEGATVRAGAAGGHFNPGGNEHGAHAGDLGNTPIADEGRGVLAVFTAKLRLEGELGVVGRSIVVHAQEDDLQDVASAGARVLCGVIERTPLADLPPHVQASLHRTEAGMEEDERGGAVFIRFGASTYVAAFAEGLEEGKHGTHVHKNGACGATTNDEGTTVRAGAAGGHFNPGGNEHGAHAGDLGNMDIDADGRGALGVVTQDLSLEGGLSVLGRSVVVHAQEDDLQDVASAGARELCGVVPDATA